MSFREEGEEDLFGDDSLVADILDDNVTTVVGKRTVPLPLIAAQSPKALGVITEVVAWCVAIDYFKAGVKLMLDDGSGCIEAVQFIAPDPLEGTNYSHYVGQNVYARGRIRRWREESPHQLYLFHMGTLFPRQEWRSQARV